MHTFEKILTVLGTIAVFATVVGIIKKPESVYKYKPEEQNPMQGKMVKFVEDESEKENADGMRGHLEAFGVSNHKAGVYEKVFKRILDLILSFGGLVILSPIFAFISIWILIDDPGPVLFTQKRVGKDKQYFKLHNVFKTVGDVSFCNKVLNNARLAA